MREVACPVALHLDGVPRRIAAFEHPQAGLQLVKGGIRSGERPEHAAARELFEESGLETRAAISLGESTKIDAGARWHVSLCRLAGPLRDNWQHHCADDGGHLFRFFWLELDAALPEGFAPPYRRAVDWIRGQL
ncbi:DNA mismatch repair protein MutT [Roseobacter cerasinus]|uniref:DNA mismatch repair protein MutT n=1 Tax=Roseobacter cerasinus TaxID=2602289 RepID=A0A640VTM1_9RHOB|nr:NUDIX domain-containing protein [Roseobacter cerasinus]GFE51002.1 DNA mismatch repair protein MutT [Roseobacter cerasinus]